MKRDISDIYLYATTLVSYNPETGDLTWLPREGRPNWNAKHTLTPCGSINSKGYILITIFKDGNRYSLKTHKLAWLIFHGSLPKGVIDHFDGNKTNNKIENLRDVDRSTNNKNAIRTKPNKANITNVRRISSGNYNVRVCGKSLGTYSDPLEAEKVAREYQLSNGFTERHGTIKNAN